MFPYEEIEHGGFSRAHVSMLMWGSLMKQLLVTIGECQMKYIGSSHVS